MDAVRDFINNLYQGILHRNADGAGLEHHVATLGTNPTFQDATALLASFLRSPEASALASDTFGFGGRRREIVSIGSDCLVGSELKRMGIKRSSGPFDWIFSNIPMVVDCIKDDFATFLDRRFLREVPVEERETRSLNLCDHTFYRENMGIRFVFNHHNPLLMDEYQYYVRCVERFRVSLTTDECLLVNLSLRTSLQDFRTLCAAVDERGPASVIVVHAVPSSGDHSFGATLAHEYGRHKLFEIRLFGAIRNAAFTEKADELMFGALLGSVIA